MLRNLLYHTKGERRGFFLIVSVLALVLFLFTYPTLGYTEEEVTDTAFEEEYLHFAQSIREELSPLKNSNSLDTPLKASAPQLHTFDPNEADSAELVSLGMPSWMASSVLKYRNKGGRFKTPDAFSKVYGLTDEQYQSLLPFIQIAETPVDSSHLLAYSKRDSIAHQFKYPIGTVLELNYVDTTELKKIPGIGSSIARRIVSYRTKLGGFYSLEQLEDIDLNSDSLQPWLHVGKGENRQINLNTASLELLNSHPYFNFYQAKVIVEHRKKHHKIQSISELKAYEEFTNNDLKRIENYVVVGK